MREVKEELGLKLDSADGRLIKSECREDFRDFYDVWLFRSNVNLSELEFQKDEVVLAKWMTASEISTLFKNDQLVNTLDYYDEVFEANRAK